MILEYNWEVRKKMEEKKFDTLIILQIIFAFLVIVFGVYCKIADDYSLLPLVLIFMSGMIFVTGLREYDRTGKSFWRILSLGGVLFFLSIVIDAMLIN